MYQALYRKWRPLVFSDVVGQSQVTDTLRKQVEMGRLSHAYLFTGTRGTGKTTCAKILSRAVNCENPIGGDPCNKCVSCLGILENSVTDVLEMDAASNSGVDNIRTMKDEFIYTPVSVKKRVYIIDEVHMLSIGAFNALLKSLEEPPPHVLFILATTETHKVPATIISRCQRFQFKRLSSADIAEQLKKVAAAEKIDLVPAAADLLARLSDGAMRDALSLLDQCASLSEGFPVDTSLVHAALGLAGTLELVDMLMLLAVADATGAMQKLNEFYSDGKEIAALLDQMCMLLRDVLMAHMLQDAFASPRLDEVSIRALASKLPTQRLIEMITIIQETQQKLPRSLNKRIEAELCLIRLCGISPVQQANTVRPKTMTQIPIQPPVAAVQQPQAAVSPQTVAPVSTSASTPPTSADEVTEPQNVDVQSQNEAEQPVAVRVEAENSAPAEHHTGEDVSLTELISKVNPMYKPLLSDASAKATESGIIITIYDELDAVMLRDKDFMQFLKTIFPGEHKIVVSDKPRKPISAKKSLDDILEI